MSLILEALRKSEAERRRAQVPDLLAEPQAAVRPAAPAAQRWPWWLLAMALFAAGSWLLRAWWAPAPPAPTRSPADSVPAIAQTPSPPARSAAAPARASQSRPLVVAAPGVPAVMARAAAVEPVPDPDAAPARPAAVAAPPASSPAPGPAPATAAAEPDPVAHPSAATPGAPLRIADLGSEERGQLPPLKLSMHMWNEAPAQRFVIIDGARLTIGDRLGQARVADITSDGVLLDWNGRLLKLPLR